MGLYNIERENLLILENDWHTLKWCQLFYFTLWLYYIYTLLHIIFFIIAFFITLLNVNVCKQYADVIYFQTVGATEEQLRNEDFSIL